MWDIASITHCEMLTLLYLAPKTHTTLSLPSANPKAHIQVPWLRAVAVPGLDSRPTQRTSLHNSRIQVNCTLGAAGLPWSRPTGSLVWRGGHQRQISSQHTGRWCCSIIQTGNAWRIPYHQSYTTQSVTCHQHLLVGVQALELKPCRGSSSCSPFQGVRVG